MKLIFVCTGNTCRSPMAAALTRTKIAERNLPWIADSAGLYATSGHPMNPLAADALTRRHIPLVDHQSLPITEEMVKQADYIFGMTKSHTAELKHRYPESAHKIHELLTFVMDDRSGKKARDIADPFGGDAAEYEACAGVLDEAIDKLLDKLQSSGV